MTINWVQVHTLLGQVVVAAPFALVAIFGCAALAGHRLSERNIARSLQFTIVTGLVAAVAILVLMLGQGTRLVPIELGNWVALPKEHFHFHIKFVFDRLSVPFVILSYVLCGTISGFANAYMHKEPGFFRFCLFLALFLMGMITASLAGTIETLFAGWELVGLSSALLVAFFQERPSPVRNGLRVWTVYRFADAAFLAAAVALHHLTGEGEFSSLLGIGSWPEGHASLNSGQALFVGLLLLLAAAGKSALVPFSGWLPRAMEGPTPSSAIFYGALSVHLGAFLLLRAGPILEQSLILSTIVAITGVLTAILASTSGRVQPDIKSALAFASLTQVGIVVAEIGVAGIVGGQLGQWIQYIALAHIIGHACFRTLQLVRAPSLLHDYHALENAIGDHLHHPPPVWARWRSGAASLRMYRFALHRGFLDSVLAEYIVSPFLAVFRWCDAKERSWTDLLSGGSSRESDRIRPMPDLMDDAP